MPVGAGVSMRTLFRRLEMPGRQRWERKTPGRKNWVGFWCLAALAIAAPATAQSPKLVFWSGYRLAAAKAAHASGATEMQKAIRALLSRADGAAASKPPSVMDKTRNPPSGDKHDYVSQALYWWPDPSKPDGLPYIQKDGQANPETKDWQDRENLGDMSMAVGALALAYYVTGKTSYALRCGDYLRAWFLNPATRMNPHLDYAQFIPGLNDGRGTGLIETRDLTVIPDALVLLEGSAALSESERAGLKAWFAAYFRWFRDSANGKEEAAARNNHGTFYDIQAITFARFIGLADTATALSLAARTRRIAEQIEPDGRMPEELKRTKALHYVAFNLWALFDLATLSESCGVVFWSHETSDGRSLRKALEWARPYFLGEKAWTYPQIEPFSYHEATVDFLQASQGFRDKGYYQDAAKVPGVELAAHIEFLLYHPDTPAGVRPWLPWTSPGRLAGRFDALGRPGPSRRGVSFTGH